MSFFENFELLAQPWWVNLFILIPIIAYLVWRKSGLKITRRQLLTTLLFAVGFGFVEAAVVVYLRAAVGLLPGYGGTLIEVAQLSSDIYIQAGILAELPKSLMAVEFSREAATMIMLVTLAILTTKERKERWGIFLWTFAIWDIIYYVSLYTTVGWPSSLLDQDVLFLIPVPWFSQVWFPILVSLLILTAVLLAKKQDKELIKVAEFEKDIIRDSP